MFHKEFYPTPRHIVDQMIPHELKYPKCGTKPKVLEPSAWKGDILDALWKQCRIYAIEQSHELQAILKEKKYKVVHDDFLTYEKEMSFDYIIMNPPFSNWDEHFLKAWEIADNTTIVCLLNSETLNNPFSEKRKLIQKIIADNWWKVYELWQCFVWSERTTGVNVSMVVVTKITENTGFEWDMWEEKTLTIDDDTIGNEIATRDLIGNMIEDYERAKILFIEWTRQLQKAERICKSISKNYQLEIFKLAGSEGPLQDRYDAFLWELKYGIWNKLSQELNIEKYMTSKTRDNFHEYIREQWNIAISKDNIRKFVWLVIGNRGNIMEQAVNEAFDHMTKYHETNRVHIEGWKTNDFWKVNKKVIFPYGFEYSLSDKPRIAYKSINILDDIDKAMCFLSGKNFENIKTIVNTVQSSTDNLCYSEFFKIRYFIKWTLHITFLDEDLWKRFNIQACKGKNWIWTDTL